MNSGCNFNMSKSEKITITVEKEQAGKRLDIYVAEKVANYSRSQISRYLKEGCLSVNGGDAKARYKVRSGDLIEIDLPTPPPTTVKAENIPLDIVYEDDQVIVINKPAGMVTHPGHGNRTGTLVNALLYHCKELSSTGGPERAGIVHRLDKGTSGLLVAAKTETAHRHLANQLQDKSLFREYIAFAWGHLKESTGVWDLPIGRSISNPTRMRVDHGAGREAQTAYELVVRYDLCDKLRLRLKTGRTHQIRVHLSHFNHPIFGDPDYSGRENRVRGIAPELRPAAKKLLKIINRPALHAARLGFVHPQSGKRLELSAEMPADMQQLETALVDPAGKKDYPPDGFSPDTAYNFLRE